MYWPFLDYPQCWMFSSTCTFVFQLLGYARVPKPIRLQTLIVRRVVTWARRKGWREEEWSGSIKANGILNFDSKNRFHQIWGGCAYAFGRVQSSPTARCGTWRSWHINPSAWLDLTHRTVTTEDLLDACFSRLQWSSQFRARSLHLSRATRRKAEVCLTNHLFCLVSAFSRLDLPIRGSDGL